MEDAIDAAERFWVNEEYRGRDIREAKDRVGSAQAAIGRRESNVGKGESGLHLSRRANACGFRESVPVWLFWL